MKVLHIIKSLGRGGAETLLPESMKLHDRSRFEFHCIYFLPWKDQMVGAIREAGGRVECFPAKDNIRLLLQAGKVIRYIRENKIDLVHCHLPWAGFLGRYIHWRMGIPVIYTEHNKQERYHGVTFWLNKLSFNYQNLVIAVSGDVAESISKNIGPRVEVKTVLNGVNTEFFKRELFEPQRRGERKEGLTAETQRTQSGEGESPINQSINSQIINGLPEGALVVGTVAVFRFQKRLKEWLRVFKKASEDLPELYGIIVGAGPLEEEIKAERKVLDLEERVWMPGLQTNARDWYGLMDVFMMSSEFEGLPIALLEAMSMECAIVSTDAGGIKEVVEDGKSGLLVGVDRWEDLADRLLMMKDTGLRKQLAEGARARVMERFSMGRMVGELEGVYTSLLKK